ncbi:MAG: hypothetical protein IJX66_00290 [Lachnospiraceae bacterium]|nr:hypothetical protein [Lachnospiraceae bacterium]
MRDYPLSFYKKRFFVKSWGEEPVHESVRQPDAPLHASMRQPGALFPEIVRQPDTLLSESVRQSDTLLSDSIWNPDAPFWVYKKFLALYTHFPYKKEGKIKDLGILEKIVHQYPEK